MLVNATEKNQAAQAAVAAGTGRFARDPAEYATATGIRLQVVDGGSRPYAARHHRCRSLRAAHHSPGFLFIPFLLPCGKEKERP
jgi:hypothetical protein